MHVSLLDADHIHKAADYCDFNLLRAEKNIRFDCMALRKSFVLKKKC